MVMVSSIKLEAMLHVHIIACDVLLLLYHFKFTATSTAVCLSGSPTIQLIDVAGNDRWHAVGVESGGFRAI